MANIDFQEALSFGFEKFKEQAVPTLTASLAPTVVPLVASVAISAVLGTVLTVTLGALGGMLAGLLALVVSLGLTVLLLPPSLEMLLQIVDGKPLMGWQEMFKPHPQLVQFLIAMVIVGVAVSIGTIFFIIPGLVVGALLGASAFLVIERKMDAMSAIKLSLETTKPHLVPLLIFAVVGAVLNGIGSMLVVGVLVTMPVTMLGYAYLYRQMFAPAEPKAKRGNTRPMKREAAS